MKNLHAAVFLSLVAQLASAAPVNLVQNGDFELAVAGPGNVPGWSYSGGDGYFGVDADYIGSPGTRPGQVFYDGAAVNTGLLAQSIATATRLATVTAASAPRAMCDLVPIRISRLARTTGSPRP